MYDSPCCLYIYVSVNLPLLTSQCLTQSFLKLGMEIMVTDPHLSGVLETFPLPHSMSVRVSVLSL
jgi:hypothetical protein